MKGSLHESNEELVDDRAMTEKARNILNRCLRDGCLSLSDQDLTGFDEYAIANWMEEHADSLERVCLQFQGSDTHSPVYLAHHVLSKLENLEHLQLNFFGSGVSVCGLEAILKALEVKPRKLQRFQFYGCVGEPRKDAVELLVRYLPRLGTLGISKNHLLATLEPFQLLAPTAILYLHVSRIVQSEETHGEYYGDCVVRLSPFLNILGISKCDLGDGECKKITEGLKQMTTSLNQLCLSNNSIGDDGAVALARALATNHNSLRCVSLGSNRIGQEGAAALTCALTENHTSLKSLDLGSNRIGDEGAVALANGLVGKHKSLESLVLSGNSIGDEGSIALGNALTWSYESFKSLDLNFNDIGDEGAMALADALAENQFLKSLDLSCNRIGDHGALALANVLQHNKSLTNLDLDENRIGDWGVVGLAEMLYSNSVLRVLELYGNENVTEEGREALGCAIQHNRVMCLLRLPDDPPRCPWSQYVEFFTGCNSIHFWNIMQGQNSMIPWHKVFSVLLNGPVHPWSWICPDDLIESYRLSMVFVLLQNRPDIVLETSTRYHRLTTQQSKDVTSKNTLGSVNKLA